MQQPDSIISDSVVSAITADTIIVEQTVDSQSPFEVGTFFSRDTLLQPELPSRLPGMPGDPVPYTMRGDDILVCLILLCFITTIGIFARSRHAILHQLKNFLYVPSTDYAKADVPGGIVLAILNAQNSLLAAITWYFYSIHYIASDYLLNAPYSLIVIYFGVFVAYFLMKTVIYNLVNNVFFDSKKSEHAVWLFPFITALEGIAFFPAIILQAYAGLSIETVVYYAIFILILAKLMTFYKCWVIFFRQTSVFLQIILYFCALEIIPLLILGGVLVTITNELKVTF